VSSNVCMQVSRVSCLSRREREPSDTKSPRHAKPAPSAGDLVWLAAAPPRKEQPRHSKTTLTPWHRSPAFLAPSMGKDKVYEDRVMQWIQVVSPDPP